MLELFKTAGIRFYFCRACMMPEIPYWEDVSYVLRLSKEGHRYNMCAANHELYNANVHLVAAAIADDVLSMRPYDEAKAIEIIATAILNLCPDEARCLFVNGYYQALKLAGHQIPPLTAPAEEIQRICNCADCQKHLRVGTAAIACA